MHDETVSLAERQVEIGLFEIALASPCREHIAEAHASGGGLCHHRGPAEHIFKRYGTALIAEQIEIGGGDRWDHRLDIVIRVGGNCPLYEAEIASANRRELARIPVLPLDPRNRGEAVGALV